MDTIFACCTATFCACAAPATIQFYPLQVADGPVAVFEMRAGACLRGPLTIRGTDGKMQFELAADVEYPTGCSKTPLKGD